MATLVGTTLLNRYFLRESAGSGGMADVYLAWDKLRATHMAVKILRRDLANSPRFFQSFAKEAELLRRLEHPSIVRLYEFEREGDVVFIVMEWVDGSNLRQLIAERQKPFEPEEVSPILQPVCSALNFAHQSQVFHCDVKPANVLIHADGRVLLSDFGVARLASEKMGGGTPFYMAPELFTGDPVDARTDIYALGITLYEMLSGGNVPFRGGQPEQRWEHDARAHRLGTHQPAAAAPARHEPPRARSSGGLDHHRIKQRTRSPLCFCDGSARGVRACPVYHRETRTSGPKRHGYPAEDPSALTTFPTGDASRKAGRATGTCTAADGFRPPPVRSVGGVGQPASPCFSS